MRPQKSPSHIWLYGIHVCRMVLENPKRKVVSIHMINEDILGKVFTSDISRTQYHSKAKLVDRKQMEALLPPGAVHQGIVVQVTPLPAMMIDATAIIVMLSIVSILAFEIHIFVF